MLVSLLALALLGLGALWTQWLVAEVSAPPSPQGHHDLLALYAGASLVRSGQAQHLYDASALTAIERRIVDSPVGAAGYMPFLNPPAAAALLSPLAALSEPAARLVWLAAGAVMAMVAVLLATPRMRPWLRAGAVLLLLTSYPAYQTFAEGQWSFAILLGALLALAAARRGRPILAGALTSVLWLKPPLFLLVLAWLLLYRRGRIAAAAAGTVALATVATLPWTGLLSNARYLGFLGGVAASHAAGAGASGPTQWEGGLLNMEGLLGLAATVAGQQHAALVDALTILASVALIAYFAIATRRRRSDGRIDARDAAAAVCVALLVDPHLYAQDCVLIIVLLAVFAPRTRTRAVQAGLIVACCAVADLAALDTLWTPGMPLWPPHLLTLALLTGALAWAWPRRSVAPLSELATRVLSGART